jgi:hypothetical protein
MTGREREYWEKNRRRGEFYFEVRRAGIGGLTLLGVMGFEIFFFLHWHVTAYSLVEKAIAFIAGGFFEGMMEWNSNEKRYEKWKLTESKVFGTLGGVEQYIARESDGAH